MLSIWVNWQAILYSEGIFNFTSNSIPPLVNSVLVKNNIPGVEIDLFVFHQANKFLLNHLRKKLDIPEEKFYIYLESCGNTVSSTIPIALKEAIKENKLEKLKTNLIGVCKGRGKTCGGYIWRYKD